MQETIEHAKNHSGIVFSLPSILLIDSFNHSFASFFTYSLIPSFIQDKCISAEVVFVYHHITRNCDSLRVFIAVGYQECEK